MVENHLSSAVAAESAGVVIAANLVTAVLASRLVKGLENDLPSNDTRRVARLTIGGGLIPLAMWQLWRQIAFVSGSWQDAEQALKFPLKRLQMSLHSWRFADSGSEPK